MPALLGDEPVARLRLARPERQPEHHELLAQELDRLDRLLLRQLAGHRHRMPVAAQELAGGSSRSDSRQNFVFRLPRGARDVMKVESAQAPPESIRLVLRLALSIGRGEQISIGLNVIAGQALREEGRKRPVSRRSDRKAPAT
jgi:hypothetical protein